MKISNAGLELIKKFEGCRLETYKCSAGLNTIGYGTTIINNKPVPDHFKISLEDAERFLIQDIKKFETGVLRVVSVSLTQHQFSALVSITYNIGLGNFRGSTLLKMVNRNPKDPLIKQEFLKWNKAAGKVVDGLTKRREMEANLYFIA